MNETVTITRKEYDELLKNASVFEKYEEEAKFKTDELRVADDLLNKVKRDLKSGMLRFNDEADCAKAANQLYAVCKDVMNQIELYEGRKVLNANGEGGGIGKDVAELKPNATFLSRTREEVEAIRARLYEKMDRNVVAAYARNLRDENNDVIDDETLWFATELIDLIAEVRGFDDIVVSLFGKPPKASAGKQKPFTRAEKYDRTVFPMSVAIMQAWTDAGRPPYLGVFARWLVQPSCGVKEEKPTVMPSHIPEDGTNAEYYDQHNHPMETALMQAWHDAGEPPYLAVFAGWLLLDRAASLASRGQSAQ